MLSASGLSNKFGLKRIWMLAMALFTASSLLCAFAGNISLLLVGRSIQGAAGAVIIPGAMSIIFHAFDDAKLRAKVVGGWSTFSAIGLIVGPLLGGFLVDHTGWPSIFLINIPLGIMALALGGWGMKEIAVEKDLHLDVSGQVLSILWLGGMTYALIAAGHAGLLAPEVTVPLAGSCILFGVFLFRQSRTANPLLPLPLFRQTGFGIPNLASFILGFSTYSSLFFFSLFFQEAQGVSASEAGVRLMPQFLLTAIVSLFFGRLHSRVGTRWLMVTSYALIGVAMVLLCFAEVQTGYVYTGSLLALMGVGMGVAVPVTGVCVLGAVFEHRPLSSAMPLMQKLPYPLTITARPLPTVFKVPCWLLEQHALSWQSFWPSRAKAPHRLCADNMPRPAGGEKEGGQMRRLFAPQQRKNAKAARNHCGFGLPCCQAAKPCELVICWSNSRFK